MGRFSDAWRTLVGPGRDPYVRRSEINDLLLEVAEAEAALAGLYDKYRTMAARFRKREQRAAAKLEEEGPTEQLPLSIGDRKRELRKRAAAIRGLRNGPQAVPKAYSARRRAPDGAWGGQDQQTREGEP